jgi:hypothetical protein
MTTRSVKAAEAAVVKAAMIRFRELCHAHNGMERYVALSIHGCGTPASKQLTKAAARLAALRSKKAKRDRAPLMDRDRREG